MSNNTRDAGTSFEVALVNALKIPGVKVNRREFLLKTFDEYSNTNEINILDILEKGPVEIGISPDTLDKISSALIGKRTLQSTSASFLAGLPGGLAMAASIPADTLQFLGVTIRLAQELAYIHGYKDIWVNGEIDSEKVRGELTLFLGVMFGVGGSASAVKILSSGISKQMLKKLPQKALTKTIYYPIIKKSAGIIGVKITKQTFAKGVSKIVPVLGGIISGGLTYASMKPMGRRLKDTLAESINYTEEEFDKDIKSMFGSVDVVFEEAAAEKEDNMTQKSETFSVADELLKFKKLLDMGVITQEEFDVKKKQLLYVDN
ncbi:bacteriochlorophyll 4-vinyl reductase [Clostridium estertheticum]|uniref:Bacteriochlorophyll 4-vinyl reductase n=1 Tax=Clostridium estertheticum TaxID=238834 RepID=A0A5N7IZM6_9CLOT|nr:SHOCT domain-containing protein [Clostridium estertheticum]MPQ31273.1 bacteriochlorophyll 4-vinyl reductase [Clostridium estertheticum]MPQ61947.1 bacteriochlorophyll 4-vinyl reductase [Clostridium estertheticum]